ncbi:unnamed protein product [Rangifer tarandus platyrhynchus]|uniref:Uncharacterized protein n=1 Tax=Rangifer tarandus platyrhynchus TaxID=3082113 RepID=A0AC59ZB41_RANTA
MQLACCLVLTLCDTRVLQEKTVVSPGKARPGDAPLGPDDGFSPGEHARMFCIGTSEWSGCLPLPSLLQSKGQMPRIEPETRKVSSPWITRWKKAVRQTAPLATHCVMQ